MALAPDFAPVDLQQAELDSYAGLFGDLNADEILLEYARISQPPYLLAGLGLAIGVGTAALLLGYRLWRVSADHDLIRRLAVDAERHS